MSDENLKKAAIVCECIGNSNSGIGRATHDTPVSLEDSGWQFLCDNPSHNCRERAQVWTLKEVIEAEPSLSKWISNTRDNYIKFSIYRIRNINDWALDK